MPLTFHFPLDTRRKMSIDIRLTPLKSDKRTKSRTVRYKLRHVWDYCHRSMNYSSREKGEEAIASKAMFPKIKGATRRRITVELFR